VQSVQATHLFIYPFTAYAFGVVTFWRPEFCDLRADFQKRCSLTNWDHFAHSVKVSVRRCLFPKRRSECRQHSIYISSSQRQL